VECALAGVRAITIVNRNRDRGGELVSLLNERTGTRADLVVSDTAYRLSPDTDIVVNATSVGLFPRVDDRLNLDADTLRPSMIVADVIPNPPETRLLRDAASSGATVLNGLGMLVNQGIISIRQWMGIEADPAVMRDELQRLFEL
jgi:shikimate dehydrogenase